MLKSNQFFYLSLITGAIILFILSSLFIKVIPLTFQHTVYACKEALNTMSIILPDSTPLFIVGLFLLIFISGIFLFIYQYLNTKLYINNKLLRKRTTPDSVYQIAKDLELENKVDIINDNIFTSFCYGIISPRICISNKLVKSLTSDELKSVLVHEKYHLLNNDPLKILMSKIIKDVFFFVPILKDFHNIFSLSKEIEADKSAISYSGNNNSLKSALIKLFDTTHSETPSVAYLLETSNFEKRILSLQNKNYSLIQGFSPSKIVISVVFVIFSLLLLNSPIYAIGNNNNHEYILSSDSSQCVTSSERHTVKHNMFSPVESKNYSEVNSSINPN